MTPRCLLPAIRPQHALSTSSRIITRTHLPRHHFSQTSIPRLRVSELTNDLLNSLKANPDRLWNSIHHTAQWGMGRRYGDAPEQTGMSRLSLSDADREARKWFKETTEGLGCEVTVDAMGNQFAVRKGLDSGKSPVFAGSHLDTQPTGGRFDGVLGVCAGVEMLRVMQENWIETEGPVVNWTNEEGARFPLSMMGSGVWAGQFPLEKIYRMEEVGTGTRTVGEELDRIGAKGEVPCSWESGVKLGAHFELHIEQGPHLVSTGEKVGIVRGAQAYKWYNITLTGRDSHTGTTSFKHRADALLMAAKLILKVQAIAEQEGGLASVGIINALPGSVNTVPGTVKMTLDIRHHQDQVVEEMERRIHDYLPGIWYESKSRGGPGVKAEMEIFFESKAVRFDYKALQCVEAAANGILGRKPRQLGSKLRDGVPKMISGAGHDSVFTSKRCPTAMIFAPCRDGVSHHPEEWCEKEDCATGASVLIGSVLRFDQERFKTHGVDD
jgi:hydantoinase/carbamoylase family amidase